MNWLYSLSMGAFWAVAAVSVYWFVALPLNAVAAREAEAAVKRGLLAVAVTVGATVAGRFPVVPAVIGIGVVLAILLLWLLIFTIAMTWNCLRWVFGVGDVDRRLGPIVTVLTAVTALAISEVFNAPDGRPASLQTLLDMGPLTAVGVLAGVEWHSLSRARSRESPAVGSHLDQTSPPPVGSGPLNKSAVTAVSLIFFPPIAIPLAFRALPVINATGERGMGLAVITLIVDVTAIEIAFFTMFRF